jgi:hypothetical protein
VIIVVHDLSVCHLMEYSTFFKAAIFSSVSSIVVGAKVHPTGTNRRASLQGKVGATELASLI